MCDKIHSHSILFESIIRGTLKDHTRYEGKKSHWMVGGEESYRMYKYTLFGKKRNKRKVGHLLSLFQGITLHMNSATWMSMARTKTFSCKSFNDLTQEEYDTPKAMMIDKDVYHPSGLFPHAANKPIFIFLCVFASTGYVRRCVTLPEVCSI